MMSFSPLHIWASMGLLSKVIASILLFMAVSCLAVVVERHVTLMRGKSTTKRFLRGVLGFIDSGDYQKAITMADEHKHSPFARLLTPVLSRIVKGDEKKVGAVELARREAERQKEAV